jgi:hypothetical protein
MQGCHRVLVLCSQATSQFDIKYHRGEQQQQKQPAIEDKTTKLSGLVMTSLRTD